jgi:hypothetical protein
LWIANRKFRLFGGDENLMIVCIDEELSNSYLSYISSKNSGTMVRSIRMHGDVSCFAMFPNFHSPTGSKNVEVVLVGRQRSNRMSPFDHGHVG